MTLNFNEAWDVRRGRLGGYICCFVFSFIVGEVALLSLLLLLLLSPAHSLALSLSTRVAVLLPLVRTAQFGSWVYLYCRQQPSFPELNC